LVLEIHHQALAVWVHARLATAQWQLARHMRCMLFPRDGRLRLFLRLQYLYWRQQYYMR